MALPPPIVDGHFSFAGDSLFASAGGGNLHRRATVHELENHFATAEDRPGHWYEAQLLHYGLPPSKNKGTAQMRLHQELKRNQLAVPSAILLKEASLKRRWTAVNRATAVISSEGNEQPAARARKPATTSTAAKAATAKATTAKAATAKTVTAGANAVLHGRVEKKKSAAKKSVVKPKLPVAKKPVVQSKTLPAKKSVAQSKSPLAKKPVAQTKAPKKTETSTSAARTTASAPRTKQTARRGGGFSGGPSGRASGPAPASRQSGSPPPPYTEFDEMDDSYCY